MLPRLQPTAEAFAIPAPTGGWDTRNALADMPPLNAVTLTNWFPDLADVKMRAGYAEHATGFGGAIGAIHGYTTTAGANQLWAAGGGEIWLATATGAIDAGGRLAVVSSRTNDRHQVTMIGTSGANYSFWCNGADTPQVYDGSGTTAAAWNDSTIVGPTLANLIWCHTHQRRLWVGEDGTLKVWYLAANSITGTASSFTLEGYANKGGKILAMGSLTRDTGAGMDDIAVFVTSEGQVILYSGTDPASAATWAMVGVFQIGRPIGNRCLVKYGGDLIIITEQGFVSLTALLGADEAEAESPNVAISHQITEAVLDAVEAYGSNWGWEAIVFPKGRQLIFNIPTEEDVTSEQYVFNTVTKAPCKFTNINASTWGMMGDRIFFGSGATVGEGYNIYEFNQTTGGDDGADIPADAIQAFNYFGSRGQLKNFKRAEVVMEGTDTDISVDLWTDYQIGTPTDAVQSLDATYGNVKRGWVGVKGRGRSATIQLKLSSLLGKDAKWLETSYIYTRGSFI